MPKSNPSPAVPVSPPVEELAYTVLARRYRPQTFSELVGQAHVARALVNALKGNRVAHAYLFTGARGVGKTSTARILAKALNCVHGPTPEPCNTCDLCRSIAAGEDVDVIEIDGASNRRIDEIREIRNNVQYRPSRARFKIYIIDEVHMLVKEAFNALLKTLEEPPPHVKFIFATTEVQKIPITILSRCQRFDFAGIRLPDLVATLRSIARREGVQADDEALELLARRAGGSLRDAQSLLDQLLAFCGERLSADQVHQLLGSAGDDRLVEVAGAVLAGEPRRALELLDEAALAGLQMGELVDQLIGYWRDLMVLHCAGGEASDLSVSGRHRDTLSHQAAGLTLDTILAGLDVLSSTRLRLRDSNHGRVLVEMALVRLGRLGDLQPLAQLAQALSQARVAPAAAAPVRATPPEGVKKKPLTADHESPAAAPADLSESSLPDLWAQVLAQVGTMHGSELKRADLPAILGPGTLVLRFPSDYNQAREYCQEPARLARVAEALRRVTGRSWTVRVEAGHPALASSGAAPAAEAPPPVLRRNPREEAEKLPLVQRALERLGAQIVRVDEGFGAAAASASTPPTDVPAEEEP